MGRISPGPTRWPPGAERRLVPAKSNLKPQTAKFKRWWTYLSHVRLTVHHIRRIKNELSDYISLNNFDALIGKSPEALAKEAFQHIDVQQECSRSGV